MSSMKIYAACVLILVCCLCSDVSTIAGTPNKNRQLPSSLEKKVQEFSSSLEASGHEVLQGYWALWTTEDCKYALQTIGNCYGNNLTFSGRP